MATEVFRRSVPRGDECSACATLICIVEIRQDLLATLVVGAADLGKADFARAAVEQSHAKPLLERMNVFGNGARRHAKGTPGRGKATGVDDPHKGRHACRAVHPDPPGSIGQRGGFRRPRGCIRSQALSFPKFQAFRCERGMDDSRYGVISRCENHIAIATIAVIARCRRQRRRYAHGEGRGPALPGNASTPRPAQPTIADDG